MANAINNVYRTYEGSGKQNKEDLLDEIIDLSDGSLVLMDMLDKSNPARNRLHQWNTEDITRVQQDIAYVEGSDVEVKQNNSPTRNTNVVAEFDWTYAVTEPQINTDITGFEDEYARQSVKAMKDWSTSVEKALFDSTLNSGNASQPARFRGLLSSIEQSSNTTNASGQTLTEEAFLDYQQAIYDQNIEIDGMTALAPMKGKRRISDFRTSGSVVSVNEESTDKSTVRVVDRYISDVGEITIKPSREIGANNLVVMQPRGFGIAFMTRPSEREKPASGHYRKYSVYGSLTLEDREARAGFYAKNQSFNA